jgi:hypothetical protein
MNVQNQTRSEHCHTIPSFMRGPAYIHLPVHSRLYNVPYKLNNFKLCFEIKVEKAIDEFPN